MGALVFAFSAEWWRFAIDANAYIPSIFLLLCAYYFLESSGNEIAAGLAAAGAMLFHELAIFFLPAGLVRGRGRRQMARFLAASLLPVAAAYVLAYRSVADTPSVTGFLNWITSRSSDAGFSFQIGKDIEWTLFGTLRLFFGGRVHDEIHEPLFIAALVILGVLACALVLQQWRAARVPVRPRPGPVITWLPVFL